MQDIFKKLKSEINLIWKNDIIFLRWGRIQNWGDSINPIIAKLISGKEVVYRSNSPYIKYIDRILNRTIYIIVGSILDFADSNTIVWGPGFISENSRFNSKPNKICAVRGPLSRKIVIDQGIECPKVYGDPALLYPQFYKPKENKNKYKIGLIPHYKDKNNKWLKFIKEKHGNEILIIDVEGGINKFVDNINSCELIASSSLHGIIVSDAYGIPSTWIRLSNNVIGKGFKFRDYFQSVNRRLEDPLIIKDDTKLSQIYDKFYEYKIDLDIDLLLDACPFRRNSYQHLSIR
ncbi:MAG: polysaccharide pyruvyl transferase family protein [Candidatus Helarchaeota archaeon]